MTKQVVEQILGRMIVDEAYRQQFFTHPEEALKGWNLTPEEHQALLKTRMEDVGGFSHKLDQRITKAKMIM